MYFRFIMPRPIAIPFNLDEEYDEDEEFAMFVSHEEFADFITVKTKRLRAADPEAQFTYFELLQLTEEEQQQLNPWKLKAWKESYEYHKWDELEAKEAEEAANVPAPRELTADDFEPLELPEDDEPFGSFRGGWAY